MPTETIVTPVGNNNSSFEFQADIISASNGGIKINNLVYDIESMATSLHVDNIGCQINISRLAFNSTECSNNIPLGMSNDVDVVGLHKLDTYTKYHVVAIYSHSQNAFLNVDEEIRR